MSGGSETNQNGPITLIFRSITDSDGDEEKEHSSFGSISERIGVDLQRPERRMVFFYLVLKALENLSKY